MKWPMRRVSELCLLAVDCVNKTAPRVDYETPYKMIRTTNIKSGFVYLNEVGYVSEDTFEKWTRRSKPQYGDVILTREAPVGEVGRFTSNDDSVFLGQRLFQYRADPELLDWNFLAYVLQSHEVQGRLRNMGFGATVEHIKVGDAENLLIPCPPVDIQRRIGSMLATYDDLIENNRRRMALLEDSVRQLYREWFVRLRFPGHEHTPIVDGVPLGWERAPLESALVLQRGFDLPTQDRQDGEVPIYGSTGILGHHNQAKAAAPGVVTGRSGTLGEVQYVDEDYWPLNTALWVKEFKRVTPLFALFLLREMDLKQFNGGASVPTLDRKSVHRVDVLIPSKQMLRAFDEFAVDVFAQVKKLASQNQKLRQARDLLLPRLMNGELAV